MLKKQPGSSGRHELPYGAVVFDRRWSTLNELREEVHSGEHLGENVQAAPHLAAIPLPVLSGEVPAVDVLAHDGHLPPRDTTKA